MSNVLRVGNLVHAGMVVLLPSQSFVSDSQLDSTPVSVPQIRWLTFVFNVNTLAEVVRNSSSTTGPDGQGPPSSCSSVFNVIEPLSYDQGILLDAREMPQRPKFGDCNQRNRATILLPHPFLCPPRIPCIFLPFIWSCKPVHLNWGGERLP